MIRIGSAGAFLLATAMAFTAGERPAAVAAGQQRAPDVSLEEWQYPGTRASNMSSGGGGNGQEMSGSSRGLFSTADPAEKVVAYYEKTFGTAPEAQQAKAVAGGDAAIELLAVNDNSARRPVKVWIITALRVAAGDYETINVVVSRAEGENETHIAISRLRRTTTAP